MTISSAYDEAAFTLRPVGAFLDGNVSDLEALADLTRGAEHYVEQARIDGDARWVMRSPRVEKLWDQPGEMHQEAGRVLVRLNGLGHAHRATFRNVRNVGRYSGPGNTVAVVAVDCAVSVETAFGVGPGIPAPPPPPGPASFAAVEKEPVVGQVLDLLGRGDELSPAIMWKVFELIRRQVTGIEKARNAQPVFLAQGWLTPDEFRDFADVINDQHRSGDDARHAAHEKTSGTATVDDARVLLRRLVRAWIDAQ